MTYDFTFKLLLIHERKKARLPLIIEGATGVGKTFLLEMYTMLLNEQAAVSREVEFAPRQMSRACNWIMNLMLKVFWSRLSKDVRIWFSGSESDSFPDSRHKAEEREKVLENEYFSTSEDLVEFWKELLGRLPEELKMSASQQLKEKVSSWLVQFLLLKDPSPQLRRLVESSETPSVEGSCALLRGFLTMELEPLFYKYLVHPGTTKHDIQEFLRPAVQVARKCKAQQSELVVFFDEVNTSNTLGLFKEILMDRMLDGEELPENIFFISAINPFSAPSQETRRQHDMDFRPNAMSFRDVYFVHELPTVLQELKWVYGNLNVRDELSDYIKAKIERQNNLIITTGSRQVKFTTGLKTVFRDTLLKAHQYCHERIGPSSVSQRDIQRVFLLIPFFWHCEEYTKRMQLHDARLRSEEAGDRFEEEEMSADVDKLLRKCIYLAIAIVYYFRLPVQTCEDGGVCRKDFERWLSTLTESAVYYDEDDLCESSMSYFYRTVVNAVDEFVTAEHFEFPEGVALTMALKENIFSSVAAIQQCIPLGIVGHPGSSKTLSYLYCA